MISPERKFDCLGQQTSRQEGKQTGDGSKRSFSYKSEHVLQMSFFPHQSRNCTKNSNADMDVI